MWFGEGTLKIGTSSCYIVERFVLSYVNFADQVNGR